jgi:predicted GH43/DUF377 family glycosyl hydrolase
MSLFSKTPVPVLEPMPDIPWADGAVFNPAAWYDGTTVHLLFRAVPAGYRKIRLEHAADGEPDVGFDNYTSYIGYASSTDGLVFNVRPAPFIMPDSPFDRFGAEDPRISRVDGRYFVTYTALESDAFSPDAVVRVALASTTDFKRVEKHGVVGPQERDKDAVIFPATFGGRVAMLHRIVPDIQLIYFDDVEQLCRPPDGMWDRHLADLGRHVIMRPEQEWEEKKIGAGPTPIRTEAGWLLIYHGVDRHHVYRAGMALLDLDDPSRVLARTVQPVLEPEAEFERLGDVNSVVFPEGAVVMDGTLHVYYGAADRVVGHASAPLANILEALCSPARL